MKSIAIVALTLSLGGFVAGAAEVQPTKAGPTVTIPEWAKPYDKNGDGKLDPQERDAAIKARKAETMKKWDKNGNGVLDPEEKKTMYEDRLKEREEAIAKQKEKAAHDKTVPEKKKEEKK